MIDIHCHLLPGIDDGPADLDTALEMARIATANGITRSVLTPHIHVGRYQNQRESIETDLKKFSMALKKAGIALDVRAAAEVRLMPEIQQMVENEQIPFLGEYQGKQVMLLEFPHENIPPGSDKLVEWLLARDIRPMIAHPERNKDVMRVGEKINHFVSAGCLLQLTASSVAGYFGPAARQRSNELLEQGWVTILASDAHNLEFRPPELEAGRKAAAQIIGEEEADKLVNDNPWSIVQGLFESYQT
jgi:protein-tyrosine phosphatase